MPQGSGLFVSRSSDGKCFKAENRRKGDEMFRFLPIFVRN